MDFLSKIKNTITTKTVENLATFLGENTANVESGIGLCLNSFMAGVLKYGHSDVELKNIINVLNDGGHTGDILNNIESFSSNFEKTQLLVTIGNNISSHFLANKVQLLVEKISAISEIRKTSASSLLSLSAPIVLGFIGKTMKENNFDLVGLRNHFKEINEPIINSLPPAINNIFQFKKTVNTPVPGNLQSSAVVKKEKTKSKVNFLVILPWLILGIAGLSVLYFAKFAKKETTDMPVATITEKPQDDLIPEDFLPDSSVANLPVEKNIVPIPSEVKPEPIQKPADEVKNSPETTQKPSVAEVKKELSKPAEKKETTSLVNNTKETPTIKNSESEIKTPAGWSAINGTAFKKNSAEISNSTMINGIISQLKNSNKNINISPLSSGNRTLAEDRAYALREMLIEKGISEDQINVSKSISGSNPNGIVYRISN
jgi:outer membrane protein OmpA-like peptidoglycan-associated protein